MAGDLLSLGVSGLLANQRALGTVGQNISNANSEGYSRQRVEFGANAPLFFGGGYLGTGVSVKNVERVYDNFLNNQVQVYTSSFSQAETFSRYASTVDELLADPQVGMMPAFERYFGAMNDVANDPASIPARQALLTEGEAISDRYNYLNTRLGNLRNQTNSQIKDFVEEINGLAQGIATVNKNIVMSPGPGEPNDLLDERDRLLSQLSKKVSVSTVAQDDGSVNVFVGSGQTLVIGFEANSLNVMQNQFDATQLEIGISVGGGGFVQVTSQLTGGALGGVVDFRNNMLDDAQNALGKLAMGFAATVNEQHRLGQDLNGNFGQDLFNIANLEVLPATGVADVVSANLDNVDGLTGSDYRLTCDGGNLYSLMRLSDGQTTTIDTAGASPYTTPPIDGFTLDISAGMAVNDRVLIRPTRNGAEEISALLGDAREFAAAMPVMSAPSTSNTGSASITPGTVTSIADLPLPSDVTLTYDAATNEINVSGAVPAAGPFSYTSGATLAFNGLEFVMSGVPADGDVFTISNNVNGVSDNRNVLAIATMQTEKLLENGSSTYEDVYGQMVAEVGIKTGQSVIKKDAQSNLLDQARTAQQGYSGVNLDEEAADLIKFQQAYQAAAQVINAANTMFDSLLGAVRR